MPENTGFSPDLSQKVQDLILSGMFTSGEPVTDADLERHGLSRGQVNAFLKGNARAYLERRRIEKQSISF